MPRKLRRVAPGRYVTADGSYEVTRLTATRWVITKPGRYGSVYEATSLRRCRDWLVGLWTVPTPSR